MIGGAVHLLARHGPPGTSFAEVLQLERTGFRMGCAVLAVTVAGFLLGQVRGRDQPRPGADHGRTV